MPSDLFLAPADSALAWSAGLLPVTLASQTALPVQTLDPDSAVRGPLQIGRGHPHRRPQALAAPEVAIEVAAEAAPAVAVVVVCVEEAAL